MSDEDLDPVAALMSVRRVQIAQADRISRGGWLYDVAYSTLIAVAVAAWLLPHPANYIAVSVSTLLLIGLARLWANHHGLWLSGTSPRQARWVAWGLAAIYVALLCINLVAAERHWNIWVPVAVTIAAFVLALAGSRLWRVVYRRESGLRP